MSQDDIIRNTLFAVLCICFVFYLFLGIYSYKSKRKDGNQYKTYSSKMEED
ncbi:MAG: hypothetical protein ACREVX_02185 [Clostridium sp.]|uniref:hypothetical protein n=1 Tax=Clostridium sp. TaxID=1506 RepID=UPI003D6CF217